MQVEVPWPLGPVDGRYVLRGHAGRPEWVLVTETVGSKPRRRRNRKVDPEPAPTEVAIGRATLVGAEPLDGEPERWLRSVDLAAEAEAGLAAINRALYLQRIASANAESREVSLEDALSVRVGYGGGEEVSRGRWTKAVEVGTGSKRGRRRRMLQPDERFAALVGGYDAPLATEELALRARSDVDAGRWREAALQLDAAFGVAPEELAPWRNHSDMSGRIDELEELAPQVGDAASAARQGGVSEGQTELVTSALGRLEAALRARSAAALP